MKAIHILMTSAGFALALLALPPAEAQSKPGRGGGGGGGNWNGGGGGGHGNWSGGGRWNGGHGWSGRGHWNYGGHRHYRHGRGYYYPWWGFAIAAPFAYGAYYYSDPYWGHWGPRYGYAYYPRSYAPYYEDAYPAPQPQDLGPASEVQPGAPGAPSQGPLYMNYCSSAKAYYPKVASCPEGWQFIRPSYN